MGILLIIGLTILPYYIKGITQVWIDSVFLAPLAYSDSLQNSMLNVLPLCFALLAAGLLGWKKQWLNFKDPAIQLITMVIVGVVFSFLKSGKVNGHYLMQLYPMLLLVTGIALTKAISGMARLYPLALGIAFLLPAESYAEYYQIIRNKISQGTYFNGEGFTVPDYIKVNGLNPREVLFFEYHIGYWALDVMPPSKAATHPSNICRPNLYPYFKNPRKNALAELKYLLDTLQPATVVTRQGKAVFDKEFVAEDEYVRSYLSAHYTLSGTSGKAEIFSRLETE
jgi:hypothetical protein